MDLEKLWTLSVITVSSLIFVFIVCWTKYKIEKKFRKSSEHIKKSKVRMKTVYYQESVLCKKVLCESTNRHQRSIIASSLMHTLDEELQRLQNISDSIRHVQALPKMMPNFQHIDASFLADFGPPTKTCNKGEGLAECENNKFRKDDNLLQSKLCENWRDLAKKQLKTDGKHIGSRICEKNKSMYKSPKRTIFQTTKTKPQSQHNVEMIKNANSGFQIMRHKMAMNKRLQEEILNPSFKSNFKISTCVCEKSGNTNLMDLSKNSPCIDLKFTPATDERFQIKRSSYSCPSESQHTEGTRIHLGWHEEEYSNLANTAVKQLDEKLEISLDESQAEYQFQNIKMKGPKRTIEIDSIFSDKDSITNRRIAKNSKNTGNIVKSMIKLIKYKKRRICATCLLGKSGCSSCSFKVPIKMQKKESIIKFIFSVILKDKCVNKNKYYWRRNVKNVKPICSFNKLTKMPSKCTIKSNNKLEHKKLLSKKHTIYTSSDKCSKKIENDVLFRNLGTFMTFADGDTGLPLRATKSIDNPIPSVTERNQPDSWLDYSSANRNNLDGRLILQQCIDLTKRQICSNKVAVAMFEGQSDFESENNLASTYNYILQQCIELTEDCLKDSSVVSFDYKSLLAYEISNDKTILTTIEEEPVEEISDSNEKTNGCNSKNVSVCTEDKKNLTICTGDLLNCSGNVITFSDLTSFKRNLEYAYSQRSPSPHESKTNLQLLNYDKDACTLNYDEGKNECNEEIPENLVTTTDTSTELESNQDEVRMLGYYFEIKHFGESNYSKTSSNEDLDSFHEISTQLVTSNYQMRQLFFRNNSSMYSISEHSWQSDSQRINNNPSTWTFQEIQKESILQEIHSQNYLVLNESHVCVHGSNKQFDASLLDTKLLASANHDLVTNLSSRKTDKGKVKE